MGVRSYPVEIQFDEIEECLSVRVAAAAAAASDKGRSCLLRCKLGEMIDMEQTR